MPGSQKRRLAGMFLYAYADDDDKRQRLDRRLARNGLRPEPRLTMNDIPLRPIGSRGDSINIVVVARNRECRIPSVWNAGFLYIG
eukprot:scaffold117484_cov28-Attheya_sp.AAC.1